MKQREIKFKVWDSHCKYFIYPDFSHPYFDDDSDQLTFKCDKVMGDHGGLERFIFQQFTGLHDKNGKEIYEGDIVNVHTSHKSIGADFGDHIAVVNWRAKGATFQMTGLKYLPDGIGYTFDNGGVFGIEVIGNIYSNPELLGGSGPR